MYVCGLIRMKVACACQKDGESLQCIVFTGSLVLTQQAQQQSQSQATQQRHDYVEYHGFGELFNFKAEPHTQWWSQTKSETEFTMQTA